MAGVPAVQKGWMSRHGHRLKHKDSDGNFVCEESGWRYAAESSSTLRCLDWPEDKPLPAPQLESRAS
jgi:UDP-2-acetamido-3-amino-2,3-dideoxy-glucuronate N-acetyltransferase